MNTSITPHAVERFVQRHAPAMSHRQARAYLEEKAPHAARLKERTIKGDQQWQLHDPECVLVMKRDFRLRAWVCVTVLPEPEGTAINDEEMEILRNHLYDQMASGLIDEDVAERVLAAADGSNLMAPSVDREAELQRINQEKAIWNRIVNVMAARLKALSRQEAQAVHDEDNKKNLIEALRYLINNIQGSDYDYLLERVEEIDPSLVSEAFLMPELYTKAERKQLIQAARSSG